MELPLLKVAEHALGATGGVIVVVLLCLCGKAAKFGLGFWFGGEIIICNRPHPFFLVVLVPSMQIHQDRCIAH